MSKNRRFLMIAIGMLTVVCIVLTVFFVKNQNAVSEHRLDSSEAHNTGENDNILSYRKLTYEGQEYVYNSDITTLLFMGIDQHEPVTNEGYLGTGGRSDCLILFIMNNKDSTGKILEISRDTMANIAVYDMDGNYAINSKMQITMQYAYGDGREKSCRLTKEAVSELLYGIPIDSYLSMNIDGIKTITDVIGGVTITIPQDYTDIDPSFERGATVKLDGNQAEKYVRNRDINVTGSNDYRMERQMQYMKAIVNKIQGNSSGTTLYQNLFEQASPYLVTDMDAESMYALATYRLDENEYKVPGETVAGIANDEYNIDDKALRLMILDLFYIENKSD